MDRPILTRRCSLQSRVGGYSHDKNIHLGPGPMGPAPMGPWAAMGPWALCLLGPGPIGLINIHGVKGLINIRAMNISRADPTYFKMMFSQ